MNTCVSRRRTVLRCLTALAFSAVAMTGCGSDGGGKADATAQGTPVAPSSSANTSVSPFASAGTTVAPQVSTDTAVSPSASTGATGPADPSAPNSVAPAAPWAGTKQFVQIENAWTSNGTTYLSVRPARKDAITEPYEAWVIVPSAGPYTTVSLAENAQVLLAVPLGDESQAAPYSQAEFVSRLMSHDPAFRAGFGYDLSFDGEGRVTRLQSLYTS